MVSVVACFQDCEKRHNGLFRRRFWCLAALLPWQCSAYHWCRSSAASWCSSGSSIMWAQGCFHGSALLSSTYHTRTRLSGTSGIVCVNPQSLTTTYYTSLTGMWHNRYPSETLSVQGIMATWLFQNMLRPYNLTQQMASSRMCCLNETLDIECSYSASIHWAVPHSCTKYMSCCLRLLAQ